MAKRKTKTDKPQVNKDLKGFDIQINPFGEIVTSYDLDKINEFLNKNVDDKKLRDRPGLKSSTEDEEPTPKE